MSLTGTREALDTHDAAPWRARWIAAAYLALVVAATVFTLLVDVLQEGQGLSGVWVLAVTLPVSIVLLLISGDLHGGGFLALLFAGGLAQAYALYLLCRRADRQLST